ncbi:exodeoxyribonuclease III [soil metagenome]
MRIATYNINGIERRFGNLFAWLVETEPDIVCLQELKADDSAFPVELLESLGYHAAWVGQRTWNGVAILSRGSEPIVVRRQLPGDAGDQQARYLEAAVAGVLIACLYLPNGNPQPGPKFDYKLDWFKRLHRHARQLLDAELPVALIGDFNVVPTAQDIYETRSLDDNALIQPQSRAAYADLLAQGWTDALRAIHPQGPLWTFWDYMRERWPRDRGMRLDHLLLSPSLSDRLTDAGVDKWVRGEESASDHAPAWIELD